MIQCISMNVYYYPLYILYTYYIHIIISLLEPQTASDCHESQDGKLDAESVPEASVRCYHPEKSKMKIACSISLIISFLVVVHIVYFYFTSHDSET